MAGLELRALRTLTSRADPPRDTTPGESPESLLFGSLGFAREDGDWPVAALTAAEDAASVHGHGWMRADPVHLEAGLSDLSLTDPRELDLGREEAAELCGAINEALQGDPGFIEPLTPSRWYIECERLPRLRTWEPSLAVGGPVGEMLPRGLDAKVWLRAFTEIQMLLHEHPTNRAREGRGRPRVNSVWLWGIGRLPPCPEAPACVALWSDAVLARGLGRVLGKGCRPLPADAEAWLASAREEGRHVVHCDDLHYAARLGAWPVWIDTLHQWETRWFEPLRRALWSGKIDSLRIEAGGGVAHEVPASARWRWWRRRKPLPAPRPPGEAALERPGGGGKARGAVGRLCDRAGRSVRRRWNGNR